MQVKPRGADRGEHVSAVKKLQVSERIEQLKKSGCGQVYEEAARLEQVSIGNLSWWALLGR
eukprot:11324596-Alexandrium_andersonii.AAC.1